MSFVEVIKLAKVGDKIANENWLGDECLIVDDEMIIDFGYVRIEDILNDKWFIN